MKYLFVLLVCVIFSKLSLCQPGEIVQRGTKEFYLQKSKQQKTTGFILLGAGAVCLGIAAPGSVSFDALPVLVIGGGAAVIGSIPLFIASAKNKKKAMNMAASIDVRSVNDLSKIQVNKKYYPAIAIKLNL
jgi:hypothetical protein